MCMHTLYHCMNHVGLQTVEMSKRSLCWQLRTCTEKEVCPFSLIFALLYTCVLILLSVSTCTVPDGPGKGTLDDFNGVRATECLIQAERLTPHTPPFSWVLFRPPWASNSMCCKTCVCNKMKMHCSGKEEVCTSSYTFFCA